MSKAKPTEVLEDKKLHSKTGKSENIETEKHSPKKQKKDVRKSNNQLESPALFQLLKLLRDYAKEVGKDPRKLTILDFLEEVRNIKDKEKQLELLEKANPLAEQVFKETQNILRENLGVENPEAKIRLQTFEKRYETVGKKKEKPELKTYTYLKATWRDGETIRSKHIKRVKDKEENGRSR